MTQVLGSIIAGGASSRMGTDKALVQIHGTTFLDRVGAALTVVTDRLVVLGAQYHSYECWADESPQSGPLSGIATALGRTDRSHIIAVGVDQPFVMDDTLRGLVSLASERPLIPVDANGNRQVTCAVYPASIADAARAELTAGGSLQSLLDRVAFDPITPDKWRTWGEDGRSWFSIDTPQDLEKGISLYG